MENCIGKNKRNLSNKLYESQQEANQATFEGCFADATTDTESRHNRKIPVKRRMLSEGSQQNRENL